MELGQERRTGAAHTGKTGPETFPEIPLEAQRHRKNHLASPFLQHLTLQRAFPTGWIHWEVSWHGRLGNAASTGARAEAGERTFHNAPGLFKNDTQRIFQYFWGPPYCGLFWRLLLTQMSCPNLNKYGNTCVAIIVTVVIYLHTGIYCANKGPSSQGYGVSSGHVRMWELGCE